MKTIGKEKRHSYHELEEVKVEEGMQVLPVSGLLSRRLFEATMNQCNK